MGVLVLNDHVVKHAWPGVVSGKLSDVAGLVFFPLLLAAAWEHAGGSGRAVVVTWCAALTALVFAAVQISPAAGDVYRAVLGALQWPYFALAALAQGADVPVLHRAQLTQDATDLFALPAVLGAVAIARAASRRTAGGLYCTSPARGS